ncbi:helix-turn-helix domain-containing protein [Klebsiella pasteurii]|uniref:helix-turn-helix domain-containing protein n=1 Tax=Klebsiella pasteurii TaxID=2587529 RepID=UPI00244B005C|nr:helix-turn-helix domain-containing protein [Klebsiella pasteurii]MDH0315287.1 helix-turn-helix domain-containing protein [Klebsiella pasteurii]
MNAITTSDSLNKAQAVLASLIESCCDLDPSEIKINLTVVNGFICDAIEVSESGNIKNAPAFRIQLARENLGLSEADLARQLNTYSDHISDWECGITEPPASMIIPLANALKCDPLWLLTGGATRQSPAIPVHQPQCHHSEPLRSDASDHASHHERSLSQA